MAQMRHYTKDQVRKHNCRNDLWLIIHGRVYDVTDFATLHPGGEEILFDYAGTDATDAFEEMGHSKGARVLLEDYQIGFLVDKLDKAIEELTPIHDLRYMAMVQST